MRSCPTCHGAGFGTTTCTVCKGWGVVKRETRQCHSCEGKGKSQGSSTDCFTCKGKGRVQDVEPYGAVLPPPIPCSLLLGAAHRALYGGPATPDGEAQGYLVGVVIGLMLAMWRQAEAVAATLPSPLMRILEQGGDLVWTPDGIWHTLGGDSVPARILKFPLHQQDPLVVRAET